MKRFCLWPAGIALLVLISVQPAMAIDLYGFASYWDKNDADGSWGAGLGISLPLITERLRLDGRVYHFKDSDFGPGDNLTLTPFDLGLQVHVLPDTPVDPYLLAGLSYIYADADRFDVDSSFGGYLGAGLDLDVGIPLFRLFGEALYRFSSIDTNGGGDIDINGFTANVGLKFHF